MFKPGDNVICTNNDFYDFLLIVGNKYIISDIKKSNNYIHKVKVYDVQIWFSIERFKISIKDQRKLKLKQLYDKT